MRVYSLAVRPSLMRGWRKPALAWLALAVYLLPATAFAQATKAGVVTTLEGNVTAARAVAPQPVVLKFKDDVFLQDRVVTGEQSVARVRGTVVVAEVIHRSSPGSGVPQPFTRLWVLRGLVDAIHTSTSGAPLSLPVPLKAQESFSADRSTSTKSTFTSEQVATIVQGLQPQRMSDPDDASQRPARLEAVNAALALLRDMDSAGRQRGMMLFGYQPIPTPELTPVQTVTSAPITPLTTVGVVASLISPNTAVITTQTNNPPSKS